MESLYFLICIIEIGIQIFSLVKMKKTKESKYWNIFVGISIASFISAYLSYSVFEKEALGLGDAIFCLLVCGFSFFSNLIIFIIGFVVKKTIKVHIIKLNKKILLTSIIVIFINVTCLLFIPTLIYEIHVGVGKISVINYLEVKYGEGNYRITNVYKEYSNSGMWDKYVSGYYYEVETDYMDKTFIVTIDDQIKYVSEDYFVPVYFSQKNNMKFKLEYNEVFGELNYDFSDFDNYIINNVKRQFPSEADKINAEDIYKNYVNSWSSVSGVEYDLNYYIIPGNGKIPTIEELVTGIIKVNE